MHVGNFPEDRIAPSATRTTLQVPSLVDALYAEIRERILTGAVPGGTPVTEMDLATQYSVARPTAKASMERLVLEGLLHRGSHKTARVPILGADDLRDLYHTRGLLEREVVMELAAQGLVPEQARKSLEQLRDSSSPSVIEVVNLDMAFHTELVGAIRSPRLSRLYRFLAGEVRLSMAQLQANHLLSASRIASEHAAILACIEREDVDGAVASVTQHIEQACARLVAYVEAVVRAPWSRSRISSLTRAASALPPVAFMTAPTSGPAAATLPSRTLASATSGWAAIAASTAAVSSTASSLTTPSLAGGHHVVGIARSPASTASITARASRSLSVPGCDQLRDTCYLSRRDGQVRELDYTGVVSLAGQRSPSHHLRAPSGDAPAADRLRHQVERAHVGQRGDLRLGQAPLALQPLPPRGTAPRAARPWISSLHHCAEGATGTRSGLGEVPVVLGLFLGTPGRGRPRNPRGSAWSPG